MSKEVIDLKRMQVNKRWTCLQCKELTSSDQYEVSHKTKDGSIFSLTMCIMCLYSRMFRKKDYPSKPTVEESIV